MSLSKTLRIGGIGKMRMAAAIAIVAAVFTGALATAAPARAAGDVCDICSINFDLGACNDLGGYPYDSTLEAPPAAISGGSKAPAASQAKAPAASTPKQAPAAAKSSNNSGTQNSQSGTKTGTTNNTTVTTPAQTPAKVPAQPSGLVTSVSGRTVSFNWDAPAESDAVSAYQLVLNGGTAIELPASGNSYEIELGAGSYEAELIATNAAGASLAAVTPIEVAGEDAVAINATSNDGELLAENAEALNAPADSTQLYAAIGLGVLVFAGAGVLLWWSLRRKKQHPEAKQH